MPESLARSLSAHMARQAEIRLQLGDKYEDHDLVFPASNGVPLDSRNLVRRHLKPILKKAGLPESVRFYDLRHTCASILLASGENVKTVSERLGHAGIQLTLDTYAHVMPGQQEQASDRIAARSRVTKSA